MPAAFCSKLSRSVGGTSSTPSSPVGLRGTGISPNITSANHAVSTAKTMTAYIPVVANEQGPEKVRMGVFWGGEFCVKSLHSVYCCPNRCGGQYRSAPLYTGQRPRNPPWSLPLFCRCLVSTLLGGALGGLDCVAAA